MKLGASSRFAGLLVVLAVTWVQGCKGGSAQQDRPALADAPSASAPQEKPGAQGADPPRWGVLMPDVGRRFELIGRAAKARRWDFAELQLEQMEKVFKQLHRAKNPGRAKDVNVPSMAEAFSNTHPPELRAALMAADEPAFAAAFRRTSETCNSCHKMAGYPFIEIPSEPGATVPRLDP
ncbi:hypothetical protein WME97_09925 [Sorangium sp. So ce367]|uniref:hypothetical protein n=1 Tax=Sorangium sp. So ce367 TaxID=3133305 RepID=UPI003F5F2426